MGRTAISVRTESGQSFRLQETSYIGREASCQVVLNDDRVSRRHLAIKCENGQWWVHDLNSLNGLYVDGVRVEAAGIGGRLTVALSEHGPYLALDLLNEPAPPVRAPEPAAPRPQPDRSNPAEINRYYLTPASTRGAVGQRTIVIREAFQTLQRKQRLHLGLVAGVAGLLVLIATGYAYYKSRTATLEAQTVEDLFYAMKTLDVDIANIERLVATSNSPEAREQIGVAVARRREVRARYDALREKARLDKGLGEQERLILRVACMFGESDLGAPPQFIAEVNAYIRKWQSSDRYRRALTVAAENGYTQRIAQEFLAQDLSPQFFYLAMQESNFDAYISGPPTRKGIAKGMWQFIPETAERYGLRVGPLARFPRRDPADDRHQWEKATAAASRYIKDIYATDAQASGLLVMASYNWGEDRVVNLLRKMPSNPRERNFWKLLEKHRDQVPAETYDYVFYIVSAAVIGENPRLFGFDFDNPLAFVNGGP